MIETSSGKNRLILSLSVGFIFFLVLFSSLNRSSLQEVDELIYGRVAQEAARDGHWLPLTCGALPWSEKPPLLLWAAALTAKLSGQLTASWPYRIWSCLGASLSIVSCALLVESAAGPLAALFAALLLALQGDFLFHSRFFSMDSSLLGLVLLGVYFMSPRPNTKTSTWTSKNSLLGILSWVIAVWIKSWFILAFFPALLFSLFRSYPPRRAWGYALLIGLGVALSLILSFGLYAWAYGPEFVQHDLYWNLIDRAKGLSNVHIENNWSFYSKWASASCAALIPMLFIAPLGLLSLKRRDPESDFVGDFALSLCLTWIFAFCFIQAQVINYLLPLEAGICIAWGILISRSHALWLLFGLVLACLNLHGAFDPFWMIFASAILGIGYLISKKFGSLGWLSRGAILLAHLILFLGLAHYAHRYLEHPDDPSGALAKVLLEHPARYSGERLLYVGPGTQALNFYSQYTIQRLDQVPSKRPNSASLIYLGSDPIGEGPYAFWPASDDSRFPSPSLRK